MVAARLYPGSKPTITVVDVHDVDAYERGRRDGLPDRLRHPVTMTLLFVAAAVGVVLIGLAAIHGSFGRGGTVADQSLAAFSKLANPTVRDAGRSANQTLSAISRSAQSPTTAEL